MSTTFRRPRPSRRVTGGRKAYTPGAGSIRTAAGISAGVATVLGVGVAIKSTVGSTAGAASVTAVGIAIKAFAGTAAGSASVAGGGVGIRPVIGIAAGAATVVGAKMERAITSTNIMQKPIDYALAGDQDNLVRRGRAAGRALRRAFGE